MSQNGTASTGGHLGVTGVALVVGAGQGMGKSTALAFANAGAKGIILTGRHENTLKQTEKEIKKINPSIKTLVQPADISVEEQVVRLHDKIKEVFGRLDYAANVGGALSESFALTADTPTDFVEKQLATNAIGFFTCVREQLKIMKDQEPIKFPWNHDFRPNSRGSIIVLGSASANHALPGCGSYAMGKYAALGMMKVAAAEYAKHNIRINSVAPGWVVTPGLLANPNSSESVTADIVSKIPMGRFAHPDEIADVVVFLSSPRASYITGVDLYVDGGMSTCPGLSV